MNWNIVDGIDKGSWGEVENKIFVFINAECSVEGGGKQREIRCVTGYGRY
jgi:hypothetical protein